MFFFPCNFSPFTSETSFYVAAADSASSAERARSSDRRDRCGRRMVRSGHARPGRRPARPLDGTIAIIRLGSARVVRRRRCRCGRLNRRRHRRRRLSGSQSTALGRTFRMFRRRSLRFGFILDFLFCSVTVFPYAISVVSPQCRIVRGRIINN